MDEPVKGVAGRQFGLIIAFLLPGFVGLWPVRHFSPVVASWFKAGVTQGSTFGGFLYITLASRAVGLVISAVRWGVIDTVHHVTCVRRPDHDFRKLKNNLQAVELIIENYYRFYQYYSNMFVGLIILYAGELMASKKFPWDVWNWSILFLFVEVVLFLGSRDSLSKYYKSIGDLVSPEGGE